MAETLSGNDSLFQLLFEEMPCYGCILDLDLNIISANRRLRENFTTPYSRRCFQVLKGREAICDDCPAEVTLRDGIVSDSVETVHTRSGRKIKVVCRTAPISEDNGEPTGVLHMSVRAGRGEDLQQAITALDSQIGAVSHGIKGLLTAMAGGIYLWNSGINKPDSNRLNKGMKVIRRSFFKLQHLAHDVLYYIRDRRLYLECLDSAALVKDLAEEIEEDSAFLGVQVVVDEKSQSEATIEGDQRAIKSAISNLILSSLHDCYTDKRDIQHIIKLCVTTTSSHADFEVEDNGIGIDPKIRDKIFSLFFNPKGIEASGVGLYIANKLARQHNGNIEIESEKGKGTKYLMRIPINQ